MKKKNGFFNNLKIEYIVILLLVILLIIVIALSLLKGGANLITKTASITSDDNYISYSHEYNRDSVYGEAQTPNMENTSSEQFEITPIACWGDDFNIAANIYTPSYPAFLSRNTERIVYNMAINNCSFETMGGRQGGLPMYVMPCDIAAAKSSVEVVLKNDYTNELKVDFNKNAGLNPCSINGISGVLSEFDGTLKFTRDKSGFEEIILEPTVITTRAMENRRKDITLFFLGKDTEYKNIDKAINVYEKMINYLETDKYLIVGPIVGDVETIKSANQALSEHFGNNFFNLYDYLFNYASNEKKLSISEKSKEKMSKGILPDNYFQGNKSFNKIGAEIVGNAVSAKLKELKFVD